MWFISTRADGWNCLAITAEQIKRTQNTMNDINRDLDKANAILRDMENPLSWIKGVGKDDDKQAPVIILQLLLCCSRNSPRRVHHRSKPLYHVRSILQPQSLPSDVQFEVQRKKKFRCTPPRLPHVASAAGLFSAARDLSPAACS